VGLWAWSFVGAVAALVIVALALAAGSEIVLPFTFAVVLAVIFKPFVGTLQRRGFKPTVAAGLMVVGLLALMLGVAVATTRGVVDQTHQISAATDAALAETAEQLDALGVDAAALDTARAAVGGAAPVIGSGFLTKSSPASAR
jgi:putative heme transporter